MTAPSPAELQVVCLCAAWCGVCREFAQPFATLATTHPEASFHWVDVEDEADWLDDLDVENFPTVLIGFKGQPVFLGTVLPNTQTLERLIQQTTGMRPLNGHEHQQTLQALLARLQTTGLN